VALAYKVLLCPKTTVCRAVADAIKLLTYKRLTPSVLATPSPTSLSKLLPSSTVVLIEILFCPAVNFKLPKLS